MAESDDLRTFIRELLLRFDRSLERFDRRMERYDRRMDRQEAESRRYFEAIREHQDKDRERLDEILSENRAQREALFRILDRMDGRGGPAPAG